MDELEFSSDDEASDFELEEKIEEQPTSPARRKRWESVAPLINQILDEW
jgi:hypothetical protein